MMMRRPESALAELLLAGGYLPVDTDAQGYSRWYSDIGTAIPVMLRLSSGSGRHDVLAEALHKLASVIRVSADQRRLRDYRADEPVPLLTVTWNLSPTACQIVDMGVGTADYDSHVRWSTAFAPYLLMWLTKVDVELHREAVLDYETIRAKRD